MKKKIQDSFKYLKSQCAERMEKMTPFDELIRQATEFVNKNRDGWDHNAWLDFLSSIQNTGIKVTEEIQNYLGLMLESIKNFNESAFQKGRKVTDVISEQTAHFIQQTKGIWDHSKWENFVKEISVKGVQVSGETLSSLGDILESAKRLYFSLPFSNKTIKKEEMRKIEKEESPKQIFTEVTEELTKEGGAAEDVVFEDPQQPKKTPAQPELTGQEKESPVEPLKTQRLTKKLLMELKEGMFLVSRAVDEKDIPLFSEHISSLSKREEQWKRIVIASANQRACQVFENEEAYKTYHDQ